MENPNPYKCHACGAGVSAGRLKCRKCGRELSDEERFGFLCDLCGRGTCAAWFTRTPGQQLCKRCLYAGMRMRYGG